ncbi:MAG: ABC transporter permease [Acidimicrobiia bacterium]
MGAAGQIAAKDLKLRVRDRSAFVLGIVAPLALAYIFHLVFGNAFAAETLDLRYGVVDLDNTEISQALGEVLAEAESEGILAVTDYDDADTADAAVEDGDIAAYILLGPGLGDAVLAGRSFTVEVVGDIDSPTATQIAGSIASEFGSGIGRAQLAVATAFGLVAGPPPAEAAAWGEEAAQRPPAFAMEDVTAQTRQLDASTFFAAGMAVFFLFFTVQFGVVGLLEEEHDGTLARLKAAPIQRTAIVGGKGLLSFVLGVISMSVLVVATHFLMEARWGPPLGVALLIVAGVLAATSIVGLATASSKTAEGAGNLGSIVAVVLGMLGGTFFPIGQGDDFLSKLTLLTPHAWFMRGLSDIAGGAPWTDALPATGALLVFALVFGVAAWFLLKRRLTR